jgi:methylmalonyl-CoA mutase
MPFPDPILAPWIAQVEKELAGASWDDALVHATPEGIAVQPLYVEASSLADVAGKPRERAFGVCMRCPAGEVAEHVAGGADAIWVRVRAPEELAAALGAIDLKKTALLVETDGAPSQAVLDLLGPHLDLPYVLVYDGLADLAEFVRVFGMVDERCHLAHVATVSTLRYHDAGADAADEIALALSTAAAYLEALSSAGISPAMSARRIAMQVAVGRDTFMELAKLRALRSCWRKLVTAAGTPEAPRMLLHAVCSARTMTQRDPWVNMLRTTTQTFAAILGGAELVTPTSFDEASGPAQALGRRLARNTGLVLREESHLGKVLDPAGGSYYLESLTDALAREAWSRFRELEHRGGIGPALATGGIVKRLEASWAKRKAQLESKEEPVLGVSEFPNPSETLPRPIAPAPAAVGPFAAHRDAESFEAP